MIGDPRAVDPLIEALNDENEWVRLNAAKALGEINDPRTIKPLVEAMDDNNVDVREAVREALEKLGAD
ncbi:MAG: HEAT repeat domain-containing protein [Methanothrix harundinacea]|nr:HEAT repeat domain-containing protein [Methanothrix harundinacea]